MTVLTGIRTPEFITLPTAIAEYDQRSEQTMRRTVEQALQQLRVDMVNIRDTATIGGLTNGLWEFDTATSGDPGDGALGFNNATPASVTEVRISETTADSLDAAVMTALLTAEAKLAVQSQSDASQYQLFTITAAVDSGNYRTLTVTVDSSSGPLYTDTQKLIVSVIPQSSQWITDGSDIYYDTGNVGVGITPTTALHVFGADPILTIQDSETGFASATSTLRLAESGASQSLGLYWDVQAGNSNFDFEIRDGASQALVVKRSTRRVGLSKAAPTEVLDVDGNIASDAITFNLGSDYLDHYEEGSWTPELWDSSDSGSEGQTYSNQVGYYTRIGNAVFVVGALTMTSLGTLSTGQTARIGNLPFAMITTDVEQQGGLHMTKGSSLNLDTATVVIGTPLGGSGGNFFLRQVDATTGTGLVRVSEISASGELFFSGWYRTDA